ncbi:MAG: Fibrillarin-like rRNA/tRNA 2'-O-methyltransferase [Candidatus Heimdallarchaeota archaeon LC_2]|nr:MAG: Fibrillarin-like rRNA/tRNA 2'-O-methyltransferase [Candidatus Heimdallarchaeota archaeon LC_2]
MTIIKPLKAMDGVYRIEDVPGAHFATKNLIPGISVYGERLFTEDNVEYREWMHIKSKLASSMRRGIRVPELKSGTNVLYLGASSGTTVSHVSDIVGESGLVFAVEFAPRMARDLMRLAEKRENIIPIVADARNPSNYSHIVHGVDFLFCDVAQPNQSELFVKNAEAFLKSDGVGLIGIKTRSISQREHPKEIFRKQVKYLERGGFNTLRTEDIHKFHKHHMVYFGKW